MKHTKKAQVFTTDFIFAVLIMTGALLTLVIFKPWAPITQPEEITRLEVLMTQGVPADWNQTTVTTLGLLTGNVLNRTKIDLLEAMSDEQRTQLLGLTRPIAIRIDNGTDILCSTCGTIPANPDNRRVVRRLALLDNVPTRVEITVTS